MACVLVCFINVFFFFFFCHKVFIIMEKDQNEIIFLCQENMLSNYPITNHHHFVNDSIDGYGCCYGAPSSSINTDTKDPNMDILCLNMDMMTKDGSEHGAFSREKKKLKTTNNNNAPLIVVVQVKDDDDIAIKSLLLNRSRKVLLKYVFS